MTTLRRLRPAALAALALAGKAMAACPLCAESAVRDSNPWPFIGAFLVLPWVLGAVVFFALRREMRSKAKDDPSVGRVLPFVARRQDETRPLRIIQTR